MTRSTPPSSFVVYLLYVPMYIRPLGKSFEKYLDSLLQPTEILIVANKKKVPLPQNILIL